MKPSKYRSKRTEVDGYNFASKAEAKRYCELKILMRAGEIKWFIRQTPFDLPGNLKYVCDFLVVDKNNEIIVEDVKGFETQVFKMKKKLFEEKYHPLKITLIGAKVAKVVPKIVDDPALGKIMLLRMIMETEMSGDKEDDGVDNYDGEYDEGYTD